MGAFLSQIVGKLLGDGKPPEGEIDDNIFACCGPLNVTEQEKESEQERTDDD